jgi:hypothetical protein
VLVRHGVASKDVIAVKKQRAPQLSPGIRATDGENPYTHSIRQAHRSAYQAPPGGHPAVFRFSIKKTGYVLKQWHWRMCSLCVLNIQWAVYLMVVRIADAARRHARTWT